MRVSVHDVVTGVGFVAVVVGVALLSVPAAFISGGALLLAAGVAGTLRA